MTESTVAIVFWMNVIQFVLALIIVALWVLACASSADRRRPPARDRGLQRRAVCALCLSNAFRAGDASVVVPLDFLRIP